MIFGSRGSREHFPVFFRVFPLKEIRLFGAVWGHPLWSFGICLILGLEVLELLGGTKLQGLRMVPKSIITQTGFACRVPGGMS